MSQAVRDLPDPMEPQPALAASSPDDLLAKMADEAIDKLMAEADKGATPTATAPPPIETHPAEPEPVRATPEPVPAATSSLAATTLHAVEQSANPPAAPSDVAIATTDVTTAAAAAPAPAPVEPPPPAADVQALLREAPATPSPLLLPLQIINSPFAFLSDGARRALGLIGLVTLVPALCALAYVLYFKHRW